MGLPKKAPMNPERQHFLNLRDKPARFTSEEAAWTLGFSAHELPILMGAGLLKPLGNPSDNGCKYFACADLEKLKVDTGWLAKGSDAIVKYWKDRNLQRPTDTAKTRWSKKALRELTPKKPKAPLAIPRLNPRPNK
jgi:hypothetical protein